MTTPHDLRERLIKDVAYHQAEKHHFPKDASQDLAFWLEAEKTVDDFLQGSNKPQDAYRRLMAEFYRNLPSLDYTPTLQKAAQESPSLRHLHLGREYIKYIHQGDLPIRALCSLENRRDWGHSDVSLSVHPQEMDDLIKRSILMADTALIADSRVDLKNEVFLRGRRVEESYSIFDDEIIQTNVEPVEIGSHLEACKYALTEGRIFLLPKTRLVASRTHSGVEAADQPKVLSHSDIYDAVIRNGKARMLWSGGNLRTRFIKVLAEIPLPVIPNVSLPTFMTVYENDLEAAITLRDVFKERFLEMDEAMDSEKAEESMIKIGMKIRNEATDAIRDLEYAARSHAVGLSGFVTQASSAILVACNLGMIQNSLPEFLGGAGMSGASRLFQRHLKYRHEMEKNRYFFMWLLKRE